ncbi:hypothetical protein FQZ97_943520 [compost metagenome]
MLLVRFTAMHYCLTGASGKVVHLELYVTNPLYWAELRELSLSVSAAHIAIVSFLEEALVPWSDDQMAEFARLILAERIALSLYASFADTSSGQTPEPFRLRLASAK